jgi:excisionase family DNA binding protein
MPDIASEITVTDASDIYGIGKRTLHRAVERGDIPSRRIGNIYLLDPEAVRLYAEIHKARRALADYLASLDAKATA